MCYRMFAKTWPDRSRRLFSSFDPVIQRVHVSFPLDVSILFLMINIFIESWKRGSKPWYMGSKQWKIQK